jgi:hypothetical protein
MLAEDAMGLDGSEIMRDHRRGIVLLSTLLSVLLLAALAAVIQQKVTSNLIVMARLERASTAAPAADAIRERLRSVLGTAVSGAVVDIAGFNLKGAPFEMEEGGRRFEVRVNDVDGLVDAYLASPAILSLLPGAVRVSTSAQEGMLRSLPPGTRYPVLSATLAQIGLDGTQRQDAAAVLTQSSENGQIRVETTPAALTPGARDLSPLEVKIGQITRFQIMLRELPRREE